MLRERTTLGSERKVFEREVLNVRSLWPGSRVQGRRALERISRRVQLEVMRRSTRSHHLHREEIETAAGLHGLRACPAVSGVVFGILCFGFLFG